MKNEVFFIVPPLPIIDEGSQCVFGNVIRLCIRYKSLFHYQRVKGVSGRIGQYLHVGSLHFGSIQLLHLGQK